MRRRSVVVLLALAVSLGCRSAHHTDLYPGLPEGARDSRRADELAKEALAMMDSAPDKAEETLKRALAADLFHGPAHNNLGILYLRRGMLYEAAAEFEWARKLLPGHPDPRVNLALTLERAGRIDDAVADCRSALEVYPEYLPALQALARLQIVHERVDPETAVVLQEIALRGETQEWRQWATRELIRLEARDVSKDAASSVP